MNPLRWYVRPETHAIRLGGMRSDAIVWAVYRWDGRRKRDRSPILFGLPTLHATRSQALRYAHNQVRRMYGGRR